MHAELSRNASQAEPRAFQGDYENSSGGRYKSWPRIWINIGKSGNPSSTPPLASKALNDHGNALATTDACRRQTISTRTAAQFMKQREYQASASRS